VLTDHLLVKLFLRHNRMSSIKVIFPHTLSYVAVLFIIGLLMINFACIKLFGPGDTRAWWKGM